MSKVRLKEDPAINLLYTQFKNLSLPNLERFHYAKLLIEQCFSYTILYPETIPYGYLGLNAIANSDRHIQYIFGMYDHFDFDAIKLLDKKTRFKNDEIDENQLLRRLASIFYMFINEELPSIKKHIDVKLERQLKAEIESIAEHLDSFLDNSEPNVKRFPHKSEKISESIHDNQTETRVDSLKLQIQALLSKWDTFEDNEDEIQNLEREIEEFEAIFDFSREVSLRNKIDNLKSELDELLIADKFINQKKLDELELQLINASKDNKVILPIERKQAKSIEAPFSTFTRLPYLELTKVQNTQFEEPEHFEPNKKRRDKKYPDLDIFENEEIYEDFKALCSIDGPLYVLKKQLEDIRINYLRKSYLPGYVFKEDVIKSIAFYLPESKEELLKIKGIGEVIESEVGSLILEAINDNLLKNTQTISGFKANLSRKLETLKPTSKIRNNQEHAGKSWDTEQEKLLTEYFENGIAVKDIAKLLGRSRWAIEMRLHRLGLKSY